MNFDPQNLRGALAQAALAPIPKLLTLLDRDPLSPTYGCFDRAHWHRRIIDFPSGMAQEFVYPLALAYSLDIPGSPYFQQEVLRDWVLAGIRYAAKSGHADGSCDDYFPYERALGSTAFALLACAESCLKLDIREPDVLKFLSRRGNWLAWRHEAGQLSNHHALVAAALAAADAATGRNEFTGAVTTRVADLLAVQHGEGWFPEYEGADPGYQTLTISFLARLNQLVLGSVPVEPLLRAAAFAASYVHPDGSFGGEYGSRNTTSFFPHGFEILGREHPEAAYVLDTASRVYAGMAKGLAPCRDDDAIIGHHAWSHLLAWEAFVEERPVPAPLPQGRTYYPGAGLLVERRGDSHLVTGLNKGGVYFFFKGEELIAADTGVSLKVGAKTAVIHLQGSGEATAGEATLEVAGAMGFAKHTAMTTPKLLVLRLVMLLGGRFFPNAIRWLLQRILIVGKAEAGFSYRRTFTWAGENLTVADEISGPDWSEVSAAGIGPDQASIYVVMSKTFRRASLTPWIDLSSKLPPKGNILRHTRKLP